jgi:hypothetical protein
MPIIDRLDNWGIFALVMVSLAVFAIALWLMLRSGKGHPPEEIESDASDYGNVIKAGHAPLTVFLTVFISGVLIWMIVYFVMHWNEFGALLYRGVYPQ